ncbi:MAG TPA: carboxylating nicotinate-nucleotide diphosphorylase [Gammaproteobacteria bacterium]|nr:carboxylating nicotinate-nucleotide diphosphorylase [Gammaproteobacteria bacterium]HAY41611.1 carboxylating nicotinate-nucleotide diphosphorylase [Gammaproteobacteria bacterium]|tara:strand:+ start:288 stop:1109 length:822 start_codon:yes stop_codon:yes gene_type:complete
MISNITDIVQLAIKEDVGTGDVSADLIEESVSTANITSKDNAVICGIEYANEAFYQIDKKLVINWSVKDGSKVFNRQSICSIHGSSRSIISAERVALNFLQTLSSTATKTRLLVDKISHTKAKLLDTRKTIPGLRLAQKYAVKCGGGVNHRMGLYDCVMVKENHIMRLGSISSAVELAIDKHPKLPLIVEIEDLNQLNEALKIKGIKRILCDNFTNDMLQIAVEMAKDITPLEASGNIDENNIIDIAETGVGYISIGAITKNISAIDLSLRFT